MQLHRRTIDISDRLDSCLVDSFLGRYVALSNFIATLIQFPLAYIFLYKPPQLQPPASATAAAADGASSSAGGGSSSTGGKDSGSSQPQQQPLWRTVLSGMLTPPTVASLAAVLVASVPVVRVRWMESREERGNHGGSPCLPSCRTYTHTHASSSLAH